MHDVGESFQRNVAANAHKPPDLLTVKLRNTLSLTA